jgi:thymidylate synthase
MRSQNMAQVLKLDMYLWARFTCELAENLGLKAGKYSSSVVSAHVFTRDVEYINNLIKENENDII